MSGSYVAWVADNVREVMAEYGPHRVVVTMSRSIHERYDWSGLPCQVVVREDADLGNVLIAIDVDPHER